MLLVPWVGRLLFLREQVMGEITHTGCRIFPAERKSRRSRSTITALVMSLFLTIPSLSLAQELRDLEPKPVPRQVEPPEKEVKPPELKPLPIPDETVIVEALKGLIFITSPDQFQAEPSVPKDRLDASRVPLLQTAEVRKIVDEHLGKPVSMASLNRLVISLYRHYTDIGLPFVNISLPEQDITAGIVQLLVFEGVLGEIKIQGAKYFSESLYRSLLRLKPGEFIRKSVMNEDVDWVNRNPFRAGNFFVAPGKEIGTTDLILRVRERLPLRVYTGYSNNGTELTDKDRLQAGFNWGNAFGLGHQLNYQLTCSMDMRKFIGHGGSYIIPLPWRHFLTFSGAYSNTKSDVPLPLSERGKSCQVNTRYEASLPRIDAYTHTLSGQFDFKMADDNLEFGGIPITDNVTHIVQFGLQYNANLPDTWGSTSFTGRVTYSPGGLSSRNKTKYFSISRAFAEAEYTYANLRLARIQRLPQDFMLILSGEIQFSDGNLLGSEQLTLGGATTVRGYEEGEVDSDEGYLLKQELVTPPIPLSHWIGVEGINDRLRVYAFHDYAVGENVVLLQREDPHIILQSAGMGLRYSIRRYFSLTMDYGWQLEALEGRDRDSRAHISATLSY